MTIVAAVCLASLLHLLLSLIWTPYGWVTSASWIVLYALAWAAVRNGQFQVSPPTRWRWVTLELYFILAVLGFGSILYSELAVGQMSFRMSWMNNMLRAFRGLPLLLILCTLEDYENRIIRILDTLQIFLIGAVFILLFTPAHILFIRGDVAALQPDQFNRYIYSQLVILGCLAALALYTSNTATSRFLHRCLAAYLIPAVPIEIWTNVYLTNSNHIHSGSPLYVIRDLPILVFVWSLWRFRAADERNLAVKDGLVFVRLAASGFLPLFAILAALMLAIPGGHPILGGALGLLSLLVFGFRSAYTQMQVLLARREAERRNRQLAALSVRDALTGLYNRRWFDATLLQEWKLTQRNGGTMALMVIDADFFKRLNDSLGHQKGDDCLREIASILQTQLQRETDFLVRYGGEEFVAMLPATDAHGAAHLAGKITRALQIAAIAHPDSPFGHVTVSIGIAEVSGDGRGDSAQAFFARADEALYQAKRDGRNRIVIHRQDKLR